MRSVHAKAAVFSLSLLVLFSGLANAKPRLSDRSKDVKSQVPVETVTFPGSPDSGGLWTMVPVEASNSKRLSEPARFEVEAGFYSVATLDEYTLQSLLRTAPLEFTARAEAAPVVLALPMPGGTFSRFTLVESSIMEPQLAAEFPEIRTFVGQGIDDPTATMRADITPLGFHAQVLSVHGTVYIDPFAAGNTSRYISYSKAGLVNHDPMACLNDETFGDISETVTENQKTSLLNLTNGGTLRTYRLACAATGEYTAFHGGTVSGAMSAITTTVNRVNGIYERDLSVRMVLVGNNSSIIYTNASTDPYSNTDGSAMLGQNQTNLNSVIGSANYDIGHVVSTGGGGVAYLRSVCASNKAGGVTGSGSPVGDAFDVDYVAHEMGHQFGGNHTFNGTVGSCGGGNRNAATAYEPGSGSTIQAYAGICGTNNLQPNSDPYFHAVSIAEMVAHITGAADACAQKTTVGNSAPAITGTFQTSYTVPVNTPFTLTAGGITDANGDALTYCWEQYDAGAPRFRSKNPVTSNARTFSNVSNQSPGMSGNTAWEVLPTAAGTLKFRCTVRDNRAGGGGVFISNDVTVTVTTGGGCTYSISPTSSSPGTAGTTGSVSVTAGTGCAWTATSNASWVTITSGASGSGNGTVGYSVAANSGAARTGTMTIAGQTFTVNQAGTTTTTTIACGETKSGALATTDARSTVRGATYYADTYAFTATGTSATFTASSTWDNYLILKSSPTATTALAQNDDDPAGGTNAKLALTTLTAGVTYYLEVTSYSANATGSYTVTAACGGTSTTVLSEGAESGATGWTVSTNVTGNNWVVSTAGRYTGTNGFRSNQAAATYPNNLDQSLISPAFSLAGKTSASLTFRYKQQTETSYDFFKVEVSTNGGSTWTNVSNVSTTSTGFTTTAGSGMVAKTISLTGYAGQSNVKIRFRLTTDTSVVYWGVAVDDILVTAQ
jgi:hypothetical protein